MAQILQIVYYRFVNLVNIGRVKRKMIDGLFFTANSDQSAIIYRPEK